MLRGEDCAHSEFEAIWSRVKGRMGSPLAEVSSVPGIPLTVLIFTVGMKLTFTNQPNMGLLRRMGLTERYDPAKTNRPTRKNLETIIAALSKI